MLRLLELVVEYVNTQRSAIGDMNAPAALIVDAAGAHWTRSAGKVLSDAGVAVVGIPKTMTPSRKINLSSTG